MATYYLKTPLSAEDVEQLNIGDVVYISGDAFTCRSRLHRWVLDENHPLPVAGQARDLLIHVGPIVLPEADGFELVEAENLPASVKEVYEASNGVGYVFMLTVKGYGGDMDLICGIDADGCITATKVLSHAETAGLGAKVAEADYGSQYIGEDASLSGVSAISGATISSKAYYGAIADAFAALETVKEAG